MLASPLKFASSMIMFTFIAVLHSVSDMQEENKLVRAVMRYMLFRQMQKPGVPVKREDLSKLIPSTYKSQRIHSLGRLVIQQAQAQFPRLFGMEMKEVDIRAPQGMYF